MSHADQLATRIVVLHRESGFLRLALPAELCSAGVATALEDRLRALSGVELVAVDRAWQRISIRFDAQCLSAPKLARALFALLDGLPVGVQAAPEAMPSGEAAVDERFGLQPVLDKLKTLVLPAGPAAEGSLQARFEPLVESALTEKAIINFFNDIVAFYLIRTHWELITKRWLQAPLAHSNAWLTVFYMVFLLVRYRKTGSVK